MQLAMSDFNFMTKERINKVQIMAFFNRPTELRKFSLEKFITEALPPTETIPVTDTEALRDTWKNQIQTVLKVLPRIAQWQRASQPREPKLARF